MFEAKFSVEPNLDDAIVSQSVLTKVLDDEEVFGDIVRRNIIIQEVAVASPHDVIRVQICTDNETDEVQFVAGKGLFDENVEEKCLGKRKGDCFDAVLNGQNVTVTIQCVKRICRHEINDDLCALAKVEGVSTVEQYRNFYLNQNKDSIVKNLLAPIVSAIDAQIRKKAIFEYGQQQLKQMQDEQRSILKARAGEKYYAYLRKSIARGDEDINEEGLEALLDDYIRVVFEKTVIARYFADKEHFEITDEQYHQALSVLAKGQQITEDEAKKIMSRMTFEMQTYADVYKDYIIKHFEGSVKIILKRS